MGGRASRCEVSTNPECFHAEFAALGLPMILRRLGFGFSVVKPGCFGTRSKVASGEYRVGIESLWFSPVASSS